MRSGGWIGGRQLSHPCEDLRRIHGAFLRYQPIDDSTMFVSIGSGLGGNDPMPPLTGMRAPVT